MKKTINVIPELLNCQIIDKNGVHCGKVDDIEFIQKSHNRLEIKALLVGPDAWFGEKKSLLRWFLDKISPGTKVAKIPWKNVKDIFPLIQLDITAEEAGLNTIDNILGKWLRKIPGGDGA